MRKVNDLNDKRKVINLSPEDISLINPNTSTCPIFRSKKDAELTKKIYRQVAVIENEKTGENPWNISFASMFHMANDSPLFESQKHEKSVPLYEAKMFFIYNHRHGFYTDEMLQSDQVDFREIAPIQG